MPKKWEKFSDVVLLPSDAFTGRDWEEFRGVGLWQSVAEGLDALRVGQNGEITGETRESGVAMLLGDDDWVGPGWDDDDYRQGTVTATLVLL